MLVKKAYRFRKVTSVENAAFRVIEIVFKSKCLLDEFCVISLRHLIALIMKFCYHNYISMEFEEHLKIFSVTIYVTNDRKLNKIT